MPVDIREIVARRTDLGTFLVHLTRGTLVAVARQNLRQILSDGQIEARSSFGPAVRKLEAAHLPTDSQRCVCFTETPLEHTHLLLEDIVARDIRLAPYGIAIPKKLGRSKGVNPVWYQDITPGHRWLTQPVDALIEAAIADHSFAGSPIEEIAPFIEQMGTQRGGYRKEFWWEREWRMRGNFALPDRVIVLCPENEIPDFTRLVRELGRHASFVDPTWGLEQLIARLAQFTADETDIL